MLVSQILKHKGDLVFTASPHETVAAAAALLHSRHVGAMVIVDEQDRWLEYCPSATSCASWRSRARRASASRCPAA